MSICLNMIVKNEAHVIERCLDSVKPIIDHFIICDTGSTDNTIDVIMDWAERNNVNGRVVESKWVDFSTNRNEAIRYGLKSKCDYLLFIDADDYLSLPEGYELPKLTLDAYVVQINYGNLLYDRMVIVRNDNSFGYVGALHEYVTSDEQFSRGMLAGPQIIVTNDGARSQQEQSVKFLADAKILEAAYEKENPKNPRTVFYWAQSLRDAGKIEDAIETYILRAGMDGFDQEVFFSIFQCGVLAQYAKQGWGGYSDADVINYLLQAWGYRPSRAEPLVHLAEFLNKKRRFQEAYTFARMAAHIPLSQDSLFVDTECWSWKSLDQLAIAAYYIGEHEESRSACEALLSNPDMEPERLIQLPPEHRARVEENLRFAEDALDTRSA